MSDLQRQLRDLFDTPVPVSLDEVQRRRPPRVRRPAPRRRAAVGAHINGLPAGSRQPIPVPIVLRAPVPATASAPTTAPVSAP